MNLELQQTPNCRAHRQTLAALHRRNLRHPHRSPNRWSFKSTTGQSDQLAMVKRRIRRKVSTRERIAWRARFERFRYRQSLQTTFSANKSIFQVSRLPLYPQSGELSSGMTLCFAAKEKKQKSKLHRHATEPSIMLMILSFQSCGWAKRRRKTVTGRKSNASMAWHVSFAPQNSLILFRWEVRNKLCEWFWSV